MAEKESKTNSKELGIGAIFLLLIIGVFIIWVLTGGPNGKSIQSQNKKTLLFPGNTTKPETFGVIKDSTSPSSSKTINSYGLTTDNK